MTKPRVVETDSGIQGEFIVGAYDQMQRHMRDLGLMDTKEIIASGVNSGRVLEIGPGPGYLGLEWLKLTRDTRLCGAEISPEMVELARRNAAQYSFSERTDYTLGDARKLSFPDESFDGVFTCDSLHEWSEPLEILREIHRVLKPGGRFFISDLRRDAGFAARLVMYFTVKPKSILPGLKTSLDAAYIKGEVEEIFAVSPLCNFRVTQNPFGLRITGTR